MTLQFPLQSVEPKTRESNILRLPTPVQNGQNIP